MSGLPLTANALVRPERAKDRARIEELLDAAFGKDRFKKTAYRFREGVEPVTELSYVVEYEGEPHIAATIRYWPVLLPDESATLLLGPIAVAGEHQSEGIGANLMTFSMGQAKALGFSSTILVGDAPYYSRFGFTRALTLGLEMPGWVDLDRFLGLEWVEGSLKNQKGMLRKWPRGRAWPHYQKQNKSSESTRS